MLRIIILVFMGFILFGVIVGSINDNAAQEAGFNDSADMKIAEEQGFETQAQVDRWRTERDQLAKAEAAERDALSAAEDQFYVLTDDQRKFVEIVESYRSQYNAAKNEMAKGGVRHQRKLALCEYFRGERVEDWTGTIYTLSSNGDGKGVLTIRVGDDIWAGTWNNSLSDIGSKTMIDPGSPLFNKLAVLGEGQRIRFSGAFIKDGASPDCLVEKSLTMSGAMTDPDFVLRISDVETYSPG